MKKGQAKCFQENEPEILDPLQGLRGAEQSPSDLSLESHTTQGSGGEDTGGWKEEEEEKMEGVGRKEGDRGREEGGERGGEGGGGRRDEGGIEGGEEEGGEEEGGEEEEDGRREGEGGWRERRYCLPT